MKPRVSVLMGVYNGEKYLEEAIESILSQTFSDFEFIIVDDGSFDSTPRQLALYAQREPRILIHRFDRSRGLSAALNFGIVHARGEYIARMDADDISLPRRFEEQIRFLDAHPEIDVLGTAFTLVDATGNPVRSKIFSSSSDLVKWDLLFSNPIAHPSALMRHKILKDLGGYNTELSSAQDYELWTRVALAGRLANLSEVYMLLRLHAERVTYKRRAQQLAVTHNAKQKYLQIVLNREVSDAAMVSLKQKPQTAQHAALASGIIVDYCNYCIRGIPPPIALKIIGPTLEKAAWKIGRFIVHPATWHMVVRLCLLGLKFGVIWLKVMWIHLTGILKRGVLVKESDPGVNYRHG